MACGLEAVRQQDIALGRLLFNQHKEVELIHLLLYNPPPCTPS